MPTLKRIGKNLKQKLQLEPKPLKGWLDGYDGMLFQGWAESEEPVKLALSINGDQVQTLSASLHRKDLEEAGIKDGRVAFQYKLSVNDIFEKYGQTPVIDFQEVETGRPLPNTPLSLKTPDVQFSIDKLTGDMLAGWIVDKNNPTIALTLSVFIDGEQAFELTADGERSDLASLGLSNLHHGFQVNLGAFTQGKPFYHIAVVCDYNKRYELVAEKEMATFHGKVKALTDLQTYLKTQHYADTRIEANRVVKSILPGLIDQCRRSGEVPESIPLKTADYALEDSIAVVVPIYKGVEETINCLKSVLTSKNTQPLHLIAINDASPDPDMQDALMVLNQTYAFTLLVNETNLGFVGTVNRGMAHCPKHDCVLLNSDTVVPDGWLDALHKTALSERTIGTVTPLSNNATICSYPNFCLDNDLPNGLDVNQMAGLCGRLTDAPVDMPTAHGFCVYIKRSVLDEVGLFDEQKWGKGYAEENDFSLRASRLGWRHVVTNKTFVQHLGSVSFAEDTEGFIAKNLEKLNGLYPDYPVMVEEFIRTDPIRPLRKSLGKALLLGDLPIVLDKRKKVKKQSILFVSLSIGGGTKVATDALADGLREEGQAVFMLSAPKKGVWQLSSQVTNAIAEFTIEKEKQELIAFLKQLGIWHVHFHHTMEFDQGVWDLPNLLGCGYDVTLHDYFTVCPRANYLTFNDNYCDTPDEASCNQCLAALGSHPSSVLAVDDIGDDIASWRAYHQSKLAKARKVFTPSQDTKNRILSYLSLTNLEVRYHPEKKQTVRVKQHQHRDGVLTIGFLGAIGPHKGIEVIKRLAKHISDNSLPVRLVVIGFTSDDDALNQFECLTLTGKYKQAELPALLKKHPLDLVFLTSIWPETFSYTYSEAVSLGLPVASLSLGAVPERMVSNNASLVVSSNEPGEQLKQIEAFLKQLPSETVVQTGTTYSSLKKTYYRF